MNQDEELDYGSSSPGRSPSPSPTRRTATATDEVGDYKPYHHSVCTVDIIVYVDDLCLLWQVQPQTAGPSADHMATDAQAEEDDQEV